MSKIFFGGGGNRWRVPSAVLPAPVSPPLPAPAEPRPVSELRLATTSERAISERLVQLAERCGVPDSYRSLILALESGPRQHLDMLMASGIDDHPALVAVGSTGVSVVDPTFAIPGARAQVVNLTYGAISGARLVKEGQGSTRKRWLVIEGHVPLRIELSRAGAEAASQVVHVINQRVAREGRRQVEDAAAAGIVTPLPRLA